ncbi:hypothetical protein pipiens_017065 [Culex pipiens pipiens]|uniref:C-type lectin domain-containing protein n=1 Tax=Culex pipiens pipiens TaxID=38569 RepID=A0ABD1CII5_CULPP
MSKVTALLLVILTALHGSEQQVKCTGLSKYFIPNFTANWFKASEYCHYLGMRLAIVANQQDQAKLIELVKGTDKFDNTSTEFWIGASDLAEEGHFYWHASGTRVLFANWKQNQPDNAGKVEHCVEIRYIPAHGWMWHWNDRDCLQRRYFACEALEIGKEITLF